MRYHNITTDDMLNGDGLRTVLWVAGCEHHCPGCQNPTTWDPNDGLEFDIFAELELIDKLEEDHISGITFSGGDPLHPNNRNEVMRLCKAIKETLPNKTIWIYTGYFWEEIYDLSGMECVDVVVDGKYIERLSDKKYHWAGSTNQRIINAKESLATGRVILKEDYTL